MAPHSKKFRQVYLDYAAATPIDERVLKAMKPYYTVWYGNPSALHQQGVAAKSALEKSRAKISSLLHTVPHSVVFTSGGTEANNLAVYGVALANRSHGRHIVSSKIEHASVLEPLYTLMSQGWEVTFVEVDKCGYVDPKAIQTAIRPDTVLVSVMYANNEIGTIEPIREIGRTIRDYRKKHHPVYPYFHTDACQTSPYLSLDVEKLHVDLLSFNGSKVYGPKGVGVLYVRPGTVITPEMVGGGQERGLRAGTENVVAIVGLAKALEIAQSRASQETKRLRSLSLYFWKKVQGILGDVALNGPVIGDGRLPNNLNINFKNIDAETLLLYLDRHGIMCSTGSACNIHLVDASHVLVAIGLSPEHARSSLRFSLGRSTSKKDIDYVISILNMLIKEKIIFNYY
jgi:cysteine desulfurase